MSSYIHDFHGQYSWLDNMFLVDVEWEPGLVFNSTEQGFVYFKTTERSARKTIKAIKDPCRAKGYGRIMQMREDWDEIKFGIMYELVKKKFDQHSHLAGRLIATNGSYLVEGNTWHDNIWGDCSCRQCADVEGQNFLGKTLMSIRAQFLDYQYDPMRV